MTLSNLIQSEGRNALTSSPIVTLSRLYLKPYRPNLFKFPKMTLKESALAMGVTVPNVFICPLTTHVMIKPLMTRSGINFEREAIVSWLQNRNGKCPITNKCMNLSDLIPNTALEKQIAFWRWFNMLPEPESNTTEHLFSDSLKFPIIGIVSPQKKKIEKAFYRQIVTKMVKC